MAGLGLAIVGFGGRYLLRAMPTLSQKMSEAIKTMPKLDSQVNFGKNSSIENVDNKFGTLLYCSHWPTVNTTRVALSQR